MERLDPTNRILAVFDDRMHGRDAALRLRALDVAPDMDVLLLEGPGDAGRIDAAGRRGGWWLRIQRAVALTQADQSVDLATYEAALRDGRAVLAVRPRPSLRAAVLDVLREDGAHFVNSYGRLMTQEHVRWRGERLPVPPFLQR